MADSKEKSKESIQQQNSKAALKGVKTPEPPQKKDPSKTAVSDQDLKQKGKQNKK